MKKINIVIIAFSILWLLIGSILMINGTGYSMRVNGIPEAIAGGFLFLSGTFGLCFQVYIHNRK